MNQTLYFCPHAQQQKISNRIKFSTKCVASDVAKDGDTRGEILWCHPS